MIWINGDKMGGGDVVYIYSDQNHLFFTFNERLTKISAVIRTVGQGSSEDPRGPMAGNYRPTQPLNGRLLRTNIIFGNKKVIEYIATTLVVPAHLEFILFPTCSGQPADTDQLFPTHCIHPSPMFLTHCFQPSLISPTNTITNCYSQWYLTLSN